MSCLWREHFEIYVRLDLKEITKVLWLAYNLEATTFFRVGRSQNIIKQSILTVGFDEEPRKTNPRFSYLSAPANLTVIMELSSLVIGSTDDHELLGL
jgi:hypothetical protein